MSIRRLDTAPLVAGLVFDLDGTVLDTMKHHWQAWYQTSQEFEFELTKEKLLSMAGMPSKAIVRVLASEQKLDIDTDKAALRKQQLYVSLAHATETIPMVMETVFIAKKKGLPIAIATGGSKNQVEAAMRAAAIEDVFDAVVTCDDVSQGKPHPETFLKAAEMINVAPELCVGYEDAPLGMLAIRNAGFLGVVNVTKLPGYPTI